MRLAGCLGHRLRQGAPDLLELGAGGHLLGVDRGLDAVEQTLEPADELGLGDPELPLGGHRVVGERQREPFELLDELGGQSARVGAVNTIVNREGRLFGFNTDGPGFVAAIRQEAVFDPAGKRVLLLGAGGAARGIAFALVEARAVGVAIANRTFARAARLASAIGGPGGPVSAVPLDVASGEYDCIVNCTSVGMHGGSDPGGFPVSLEGARHGALIVDIVYAPEETPFLAEAKRCGMQTLGGLPMLIYQGALSFELWTGVRAPIDVMFAAARNELATRAGAQP